MSEFGRGYLSGYTGIPPPRNREDQLGGAPMSAPNGEVGQKSVVQALDRQAAVTGSLTQLVDTLKNRLTPVLRDVAPEPEPGAADKAKYIASCPLTTAINANTELILMVHRILEDIFDRLEV